MRDTTKPVQTAQISGEEKKEAGTEPLINDEEDVEPEQDEANGEDISDVPDIIKSQQ